jgi:hypothetical protein
MIDCRRQFKLNVRPRCNVLRRLVHESSRVYSSSHYPIFSPSLYVQSNHACTKSKQVLKSKNVTLTHTQPSSQYLLLLLRCTIKTNK